MDEKKNRILRAAEELFARFGIRKTTMDEIARNARMGKSTLYYYFKSKEAVFEAVIKKDSCLFRTQLLEAINREGSSQKKITNYVLTRMIHLRDLSNYYSTMTDEYLEHYHFVEQARKDFANFEMKTLISLLKEGMEQGVFSIEKVEATARSFAIVLKGLEFPLLVKNKNSNIEQVCGQMLNILFRGIEAR